MTWVTPVSLVGEGVRLDPLVAQDAHALAVAAVDGELWNLWFTSVPHPDRIEQFVAERLAQQAEGRLGAICCPRGREGRWPDQLPAPGPRQPAPGDRRHLVRRQRPANRRQHRDPNCCCWSTPSRHWAAWPWSSAPITPTPVVKPRSSGLGRIATGC